MPDHPIISCPECKKKFKGKSDLAGKKIKCPFCAKPFVVMANKSAAADEATVPPAPQTRKIFEDEPDPGAYGVTALDLSPRCPNCTQPMKDDKAFICVYCGYNTMTREIGRTEKLIAHTTGEIFMHQAPGYACVAVILLLVFNVMFYALALPRMVSPASAAFWGHESLKMWFTLIQLSIIWGCGTFAYKRLIVAPLPPDKKVD